MINKIRIFTVLACCLVVVGCSSGYSKSNSSPMPTVSDEAKEALAQKVNCATAKQDIKTLEDEKASVAGQALAGVRSVMPIAVVAGLLLGDYSDRVQVATGKYNSDIEAKIAQIRRVCRIY